jgi:hypothetical protein
MESSPARSSLAAGTSDRSTNAGLVISGRNMTPIGS